MIGTGHTGIETGMGTLTDETETIPRDIIAEVTVTDDLAVEVTNGIATVAGTEQTYGTGAAERREEIDQTELGLVT